MAYLFLSAVSLISIAAPKSSKIARVVAPVLLFLFVAFAFGAGYDWIGYYGFYKCYQFQLCDTTALAIEPGFVALLSLPTPFGYQFAPIVAGALVVASLVWFVKKTNSSFAVFAYFVLMYGWYLYIEQIRQAMALSVVLIGIPFLLKNRPIPYALSVFAAMFFHVSALTAIVPFLLSRVSLKTARKWVGLMTTAFVLVAVSLQAFSDFAASSFLASTIIADKLAFYASSENYNRAFAGIGLPIDILFFVFVSRFRGGKTKVDRSDLVFLLCQFFFLLLIFSRLNTILFRFTYYFAPFVALFLDRLLDHSRVPAISEWKLKLNAGSVKLAVVVAYLAIQNTRPFLDPVIGPSIFDYRWYPVHELVLGQSRDGLVIERCDQLQDLGAGYLCGRL
jgi:uncharacterized membrane protein YccF (DUF307 family)